jgi:cupin 2 domain-containing protein
MAANPEIFSLLASLPARLPAEQVDILLSRSAFRLERIVSRGQRTADGFWYDQEENEWVVLLSGGARLQFADEEEEIVLAPGDALLIPARRRHRVTWTDPEAATVWLALHYV